MNAPMKMITMYLPDKFIECLDAMKEMGYFPSRSEAIRQALKQFLTYEQELNRDLVPARFRELKDTQIEELMMYK